MVAIPTEHRPTLSRDLSVREFRRWYWLKEELEDFARSLGVRATGGKELLTARISAWLDGVEFVEPVTTKPARGRQLVLPLSPETLIPVGQRCSQVLRVWLTEQIGPSFHFDSEMRDFFAHSDGTQTLADAITRWNLTRSHGAKPIDKQFEYNRFTRAWHQEHPDGARADLLADWQRYKSKPADER